ncbi:MAG TPA: M23 family metallopeptidase [Micromonosporaceae bacterium]|nr:M23 family metallopeptidase [Micromonosporaceae bacterium]
MTLLLVLGIPLGPARWDPAEPVGTAVSSGGFRWPLDGSPAIVRRFDPPPVPWAAGHRGVDLAASPGAFVRSAGSGVVSFAGRIAGRGVVTVAHAAGLRTTYEPVEAPVRVGTSVAAGDRIGVLAAGHPGCPSAACLHWGLRHGERYLDPLSLLGLGRLRLLPVQASSAIRAGRRRASGGSSARLWTCRSVRSAPRRPALLTAP